MIINSSQLSMDASTGHKDVSRTLNGQILSRNHSGRNEAHFNLDLPDLEQLRATHTKNTLAETTQSSSSTIGMKHNSEESGNGQVISRVVSGLTGTTAKMRRFDHSLFRENVSQLKKSINSPTKRFYKIGGQQFSMVFSSTTKVHYEHEYYNYNSQGTVNTADGRNIDFSLNLSVQRTTIVRETLFSRINAGYMTDPLVLNFDSGLENLFEQPFLFDLTGDGMLEAIPGMHPGSGFLALDLDENNTITSGKELFGPLSGSGFDDLAIHDIDGNRWIDENDPIFDKLLVWMNPSSGAQKLLSLKEAGVGAIALANTGTRFNLKSPNNTLLGQVAASGIFLTEKGETKSLQDIHLNISNNNSNDQKNKLFGALYSAIADHRETLSNILNQQISNATQRKEEEPEKWNFWDWQKNKRPKTLI